VKTVRSSTSVTHGALLALDAGAVEAQRRHALRLALDVEDALVVPLAGLRLRKVSGRQRDGLRDPDGDVDLSGRQNLRTVLRKQDQHQLSSADSNTSGKRNPSY